MLSQPGISAAPHIRTVLAMQDLDQAEAKAAFVWILGHYGESIQAWPPAVKQGHASALSLECFKKQKFIAKICLTRGVWPLLT